MCCVVLCCVCCCVVLCCAVLCCVVLCCAVLCCAVYDMMISVAAVADAAELNYQAMKSYFKQSGEMPCQRLSRYKAGYNA